MNLNITFRGLEPSEALKSHLRDRVEHVARHLDHAVESSAVLSLERYLQQADLSIHAGPFVMRGKSRSEDMYKSIDEAIDRIERQLKRYKSRLRTQKHRARAETLHARPARHEVLEVRAPELDEGESWTQGPKVIRTDEFPVQVLTVDEAVMQMDLMNNEFLVFINAQTRIAAVIYRRKDGHFGLIEAPTGTG